MRLLGHPKSTKLSLHKVREAALVVDVGYSYSGGRRARCLSFPFLTSPSLRLSSLPRTSTSPLLYLQHGVCPLKPSHLHSSTKLHHSPPHRRRRIRLPVRARCRVGSSTAQGLSTSHITIFDFNCLSTPPSSIFATSQSLPHVGPATPSSTTLPSPHNTNESLALTRHHPLITYLKTRERRAHPPRPPAGN